MSALEVFVGLAVGILAGWLADWRLGRRRSLYACLTVGVIGSFSGAFVFGELLPGEGHFWGWAGADMAGAVVGLAILAALPTKGRA